MQVGLITVDGTPIGVVTFTYGSPDTTNPIIGASPRGGDLGGDAYGATSPHGHGSQTRHHSRHLREEDQAHGHGTNVRHHSRKIREQDRSPVTLGKGDDPRGLEGHIRSEAKRYGVDPDTAVRVAKSEGLRDFSGDHGTSFGAFQLHKKGGLGDRFQKETGLDPADPANEKATISWALKNAKETGWGPYHGAARVGIGRRQGIDGGTSDLSSGVRRGSANLFSSGRASNLGIEGGVGQNLTTIATPSGKKVTVNAEAAPHFKAFLADLESSGYKINDLSGFNARNKRGGGGWSEHAFGNAIDINPAQNPWRTSTTNLPSNVSDMAAKHGLSWGGDWSPSSRDPMHFEWTGAKPKPAVTADARDDAPKSATSGRDKLFDPETMVP